VPNPFEKTVGVPVVEVGVNRRLKPGSWSHARGEFEHVRGVIDRIYLLTFLGLVVAFWAGFPLRGVIGERLLRDDDDNPLAPFNADPGEVAQLENPEAKTFEFKAADRDNLSVYPELSQLAALTKTPRHYFPLAQAMANLSADAIRADEGALAAKVTDHKGSLGEGWEEVLRICGLMSPTEVDIGPRAELVWADHESRSLAERADAAVKLHGLIPDAMLWERVLNFSQEEIRRAEGLMASQAFRQLVATAQQPNGNGNGAIPGAPEPASAAGPQGRTPAPPRGNEPRV
jgi:hypothetical protein